MKLLLQKDSSDGFFTAVYQYYYVYGKAAEGIFSAPLEDNFLDEYVEVRADEALAEKVKSGLVKSGGVCFLDEILFALKSGDKNKFNVVLKYLELFFKYGEKVKDMFGEKSVRDFFDIKRKVEREIERLLGFIRLKETSNGIFYGFFSSDNDILECVAPEFAKRFNTLSFFLHDYKRKKAAFYDGQEKIHSVIDGEKQIKNQDSFIKCENKSEPIKYENQGGLTKYTNRNETEKYENQDDLSASTGRIKNGENRNEPEKIQIQYGKTGENLSIELSERETVFQSLFKEYNKTVAIKGRENLKLQRAFAPKKYRDFMSEFD
jgi:probable DNA metabolism protein